jgi:hypothetical protein
MNAFGASFVSLICAFDAKRNPVEPPQYEGVYLRGCGSEFDVACDAPDRPEWIEKRGLSGTYRICRFCFRD